MLACMGKCSDPILWGAVVAHVNVKMFAYQRVGAEIRDKSAKI